MSRRVNRTAVQSGERVTARTTARTTARRPGPRGPEPIDALAEALVEQVVERLDVALRKRSGRVRTEAEKAVADGFYTVEEVAGRLACSKRSVLRLIADGLLRATPLKDFDPVRGQREHVRVAITDFEAYASAQREKGRQR